MDNQPLIYRIGDKNPEFARLDGGQIVEVSGPKISWALGMSFGTLRKECHRRKHGLTRVTARTRYRFEPTINGHTVGYDDL